MRITFAMRKFRNVERNWYCDVLHITTVRVARLVLDCNGVFAIKAYDVDLLRLSWILMIVSSSYFNYRQRHTIGIAAQAFASS